MASAPLPAHKASSPEPPTTSSRPQPPNTASSPRPPLTKSPPRPPLIKSSPATPCTASLPLHPVRRSLPREPSIQSLPGAPTWASAVPLVATSISTIAASNKEALFASWPPRLRSGLILLFLRHFRLKPLDLPFIGAFSRRKRLTIILVICCCNIFPSLNVSFPSRLDSRSYMRAGDDEFSMNLASLSISDDFHGCVSSSISWLLL